MTINGNIVSRIIAELNIRTIHQGNPKNELAFMIVYLTPVIKGSKGLKKNGISLNFVTSNSTNLNYI
jgi:hypothetical protein